MNPQLHYDMLEALTELEVDKETQVLVLTGAGPSWCAGQDLREYFRGTDNNALERRKASWASQEWRWRRLFWFPKPTIAMVNGWCFGGAFTPLAACDLAVAADEATFGLSEINWGIIPAGVVCKAISTVMSQRDAMYYIMTGETFDGRRAAQMRLVNESVPLSGLKERVRALAKTLLDKNPTVLRQAKTAFRYASRMGWDEAADYLFAKSDQSTFMDPERGREEGMRQFLDEKSYKPGLGTYKRKR